ncbi:MAG: aldolase, partial [Halodesulfurarchaeum sp.]
GMEWAIDAAGPVKVVMSGGSKRNERSFLESVRAVLDAGGAGLAVGRNVWQRENPNEMLDALEALIHEDATVDAALEFVQ